MNFRKRLEVEETGFQLAPMVDVMFILLIFFLMTAAFSEMESEMDITLPAAQEARPVDRGPRDIVVNIRANGVMIINRQPVTSETLLSRLKMLSENNPNQGVIIRADGKAYHEYAIHVMDLCRQANISDISFSVVQQQGGPETP